MPVSPTITPIHVANAAAEKRDPLVEALIDCGRMLQRGGYRFITVTPDTHAVVVDRRSSEQAQDWRDAFGWNLPFVREMMPVPLFDSLSAVGLVEPVAGGWWRLLVRCSTIGEQIFLHSGYPTSERDAVFFGPDTYRFVKVLNQTLRGGDRLLELGTGTGAAAITLAERYRSLVLTDINPRAIRFAEANCALAGCTSADLRCTNLVEGVTGVFDAIIANPPYLIDPTHRLYRDGGELGIAVAVEMVRSALPLLAPGGRLVLYGGAPVVAGRDLLAEALAPLIRHSGMASQYDELDVDVFGSSLATDAYIAGRVERLALVAMIIDRPGSIPPETNTWRHP